MELLPLAATAAGAGATAATAAGATALAGTLSTISTVGTILGAAGSVIGGIQKKSEADFEAKQLQVNAGQARAQSQREADVQRQKKEQIESRSQAVAAASGGGAADPTVVDVTGQIEQQGTMNELNALYDGEFKARGMEADATAKQMEGSQALTSGITEAVTDIAGLAKSTILQGSSSMYDRFATKAPASSTYYRGSNLWVDWDT